MKYTAISKTRSQLCVKKKCWALSVSVSGFYSWKVRPKGCRDAALLLRIREVFEKSRRTYGSPRITASLRSAGLGVNHKRVERLMRENHIRPERRARFRPRKARFHREAAPNLLGQRFIADKLNQIWLTDITYVRVGRNWSYLCVVMDLFNREIVGWAMSMKPEANLAVSALKRALAKRHGHRNLILHSDRGLQFLSETIQDFLAKHEIIPSHSRLGNCYDNAPIESFFKTLKKEEIYRHRYESLAQARSSIFDYIELFYNRQRIHSSLNYQSPIQYSP